MKGNHPACFLACLQPFKLGRPSTDEERLTNIQCLAQLCGDVLKASITAAEGSVWASLPVEITVSAASVLLSLLLNCDSDDGPEMHSIDVLHSRKAQRARNIVQSESGVFSAVCARWRAAALSSASSGSATDCDIALPVLLTRLLVELSGENESSGAVGQAGCLDIAVAYLSTRCRSLRDPLLPLMLELVWSLTDDAPSATPHFNYEEAARASINGAAAVECIAGLAVQAVVNAKSQTDRALRNDAIALLLSLVRRGGLQACSALGRSGRMTTLMAIAAAGCVDASEGTEPAPPSLSSTSHSHGRRWRLGRTAEDVELLQLLWHLAVTCCSAEARVHDGDGSASHGACLQAVIGSRLIHALLGHLQAGSQQSGSSGASFNCSATAATRTLSLRADAWSPGQQRLLEEHVLTSLACLAPLAAPELMSAGAVATLVTYARDRVTGFVRAAGAGAEGTQRPRSLAAAGATNGDLHLLLLSLRILRSLVQTPSSAFSTEDNAVFSSSAITTRLTADAALARDIVDVDAPHNSDDDGGDVTGLNDRLEAAFWAEHSDASEATDARITASQSLTSEAASHISSSGLLDDLVAVLRRYGGDVSALPPSSTSTSGSTATIRTSAAVPVTDALATAALDLLSSLFSPPAESAQAEGALTRLLALAPHVLNEDGLTDNRGTQRALGQLYARSACTASLTGVEASGNGGSARADDSPAFGEGEEEGGQLSARESFRRCHGLGATLAVLRSILSAGSSASNRATSAISIARRRTPSSSAASVVSALSPAQVTSACAALRLLHHATVGDASAEGELVRLGGLDLLVDLAASAVPRDAKHASTQPLWGIAVSVLADLCTSELSRQVLTSWRHPVSGASASQLLLTSWAGCSPSKLLKQLQAVATTNDGEGGMSDAAAQELAAGTAFLRKLFALITAITPPPVAIADGGTSSSPRSPSSPTSDQWTHSSVRRFPSLVNSLVWRHTAEQLAAVTSAVSLSLTSVDEEALCAQLEGTDDCLRQEADDEAQRVSASCEATTRELLSYTAGLKQLSAQAEAALPQPVDDASASDSACGGLSPSPVRRSSSVRLFDGGGGEDRQSVSTRMTKSTFTGIQRRLRQQGANFTLDERKAAQRHKADMLERSFVGYGDHGHCQLQASASTAADK